MIAGGFPGSRAGRKRGASSLNIIQTNAQQIASRGATSSAALEAGAYLGFCTNPFMEISQENGATLLTLASATPKYGVDQMVGSFTGTMVIKSQQVATPFSATATFKRFLSSQQLSVTTAAALSAGHFVNLYQPIEGNIFKGMGWGAGDAASIDVVAVVSASVTGTYSLYVQNAAASRSYVVSVILTANTPTVVFATIPGDTPGTWPTDISQGLSIGFNVGAGSTFVAPSNNAWQAGNYYGVSGNTNLSATNAATFTVGYLNAFPTGVMPYTSAAQLDLSHLANMRRSYDSELLRCLRYYAITISSIRNFVAAGGAGSFVEATIFYPTIMRTTPSAVITTTGTRNNATSVVVYPVGNTMARNALQVNLASTDTYSLGDVINFNARM